MKNHMIALANTQKSYSETEAGIIPIVHITKDFSEFLIRFVLQQIQWKSIFRRSRMGQSKHSANKHRRSICDCRQTYWWFTSLYSMPQNMSCW